MNNLTAIMISSSTTISTIQPTPATHFLASASHNIVETHYNNATNDSVNIEESEEEIPNRLMIALILQSSILIVFLGNALVLVALACYRNWTTTDVLLFSLSTADLLNSIVGVELITVVKYFLGRSMSKLLCDVFVVAVYSFRTASATTVTGIALERAILFIYPLKHHTLVTTPCTKKIVAGIWLFSIFFGFLPFIGIGHPGFQNGKCFYQLSDLGIEFTILIEIYGALMLLTVFASYIAIKLSGAMFIRRQTQMAGCGEKRQRSASEQGAPPVPTESVGKTRRTSAVRNVQRLALMMSIVVMVYFITWLPFLLHNLYCLIVKKHPSTKIALLTSLISFLHAVVNPPLYGYMSQRYRRGYFFVFKMALSVCGGHRPPRRSLSENHVHYIPTNMIRQLSAAEIAVQGSTLSLPLAERAPALIKERKKTN